MRINARGALSSKAISISRRQRQRMQRAQNLRAKGKNDESLTEAKATVFLAPDSAYEQTELGDTLRVGAR